MTVPTLGEGQYWEHLTWGEGEGEGEREGGQANKQERGRGRRGMGGDER